MDLAAKARCLVAFLLGPRALNRGAQPFELSEYCTACQGCCQPRNQCGMLWACGGTHLWSDHAGTFTLLHVVFAELGVTRTLTVVLAQCYCCCLWRAPQLSNKSFLTPVLPASLWCFHHTAQPGGERLQQCQVKHAHCHSENREVLRLSYDLAIGNGELLAQFGSQCCG